MFRKKIIYKILFTVFFVLSATVSRAQFFVLGTEVTSDVLMAPALSMELVTGNKTSLSINGLYCGGSWLGALKEAQVTALQPEFRFWFSGRPIHKWFVGAGGIGALYKITHKDKVYDGYALGLGVTYGYVVNLTQRLNIDIHSGIGFLYYKRKEYFLHDSYDTYYAPDGQPQANAKGFYLLPTRIGVSVTYILK